MIGKSYIWFDGDMLDAAKPALSIGNRAFAYGDGLFETIHAFGTTARHVDLHIQRLTYGMSLLHMDIPSFLTVENISNEITRLLNKNRLFGSTRIRLTVFRREGGLYTPTNNAVHIVIESKPLSHKMFDINTKGITIDIYPEMQKPLNALSSIKSCNALFYVMAGIYKEQNELDDCILLNDQGRISEGTSSNIFILRGKELFTPSLAEGCVAGITRKLVIDIANTLGLQVRSQVAIHPELLLEADEVFFTNAISGIRWAVGYQQRRYFSKVSRLICDKLNRVTFPDQFNDGFSG
ncbi:MAG: aminotransferase class IV [Bacteroidales bacterium]|nr:aminotransferase class IV [Bacteroidales bacterium]MBN2748355.1 aminotransferase class IV [Bacteroidales bacterium]